MRTCVFKCAEVAHHSGQHLLDLSFALPAKFIDVCGICTKEVSLELCSLQCTILVSTSAKGGREVNTAHPLNFCLRGMLLPLAPCVLLVPLLTWHGDSVPVQQPALGYVAVEVGLVSAQGAFCGNMPPLPQSQGGPQIAGRLSCPQTLLWQQAPVCT